MNQPQLSILIVSYQCLGLVRQCLSGLYAHTQGVDFEVLLIDNSDDGTAQAIASEFPQVRVQPGQGNLGFARGNNVLAAHARGSHLLLLNPDTVVQDNAIGQLFAFAQHHPDGGAFGGLTQLENGQRDPSCMQAGPSLTASFMNAMGLGRHYRGGLALNANQPAQVPVLSGAFMMVPREVWNTLGGFDESFFMYNEEVDLCYRIAHQLRRPVWMTPDAQVMHLVGRGGAANPRRITAMMKSLMHFDRKYYSPWHHALRGLLIWLHGATRYGGSFPLQWLRGPEVGAQVRAAFGPIVWSPQSWWFGYTRESD